MKRRIMPIYIILILLLFSSCSYSNNSAETNRNFCGVWVATTANLDFPSKPCLSGQEIRGEIEDICAVCSDNGINHIFLQVRANADSIYPNSIFGPSAAIYGKREESYDVGFDVLKEFLNIAHKSKIKLYAWINPYRIGSGDEKQIIESLPSTHPAVKSPEIVMKYDGGVAMDPGVPKTRDYILAGIKEIVENYDVDGIVFDDYFYPYGGGYDDTQTYRKYGANFAEIEDFRRYSVNRLVQSCSEYLSKINIDFGISPFGIWNNDDASTDGSHTRGLSAYDEIYADSKLWVEKEWLDFIAPQIYWSDENEKASFTELLNWWSHICDGHQTNFYVSHYVSRVGSDLEGWQDVSELDRQIRLCLGDTVCDGSVFFHYFDLKNDLHNECQTVAKYYK